MAVRRRSTARPNKSSPYWMAAGPIPYGSSVRRGCAVSTPGWPAAIEVISEVGLVWRLRKAGPHAAVSEESAAEKRALYVVAITLFLLAIDVIWEA
jgi:hypothetical protein